MPIVPLPVFEEEADPKKRGLSEEEIAALLLTKPPSRIMAAFGYQRFIGEFSYRLDVVPHPGTKVVVRTQRGTEVAEVRAHAKKNCDNCPRRIDHRELPDSVIREYVDKSGGRQYTYVEGGRVLRIATQEDLDKVWMLRNERARPMRQRAQELAEGLALEMSFIEVEPILGEEQLTFFFMADGRVDFRELVRLLAAEYNTRIELRQVGARDEARVTADYERCGQHCCCRQFLKVLKPVSMKAAKMQKATLDPLKISGRCGRLMCCLRYEDDVYRDLKSNLPHKRTRVGTESGPGIVIDSQIITQLVLVELEHDQTRIA
ncbi:MAG: PSP1 domain-containing protein, partial [Planctomycetota bacterium]